VWGDYEAAIKENEKVLYLSADNPPSDDALFNLGIIYAHYGNPQSNYGKSIYFFKKLLKDYPKSSLLGEATIWAKLLEENQRFNKELEKLTQIIEKSKSENQRLNNKIEENQRFNKELEKLTQIIEKSKSENQRLDNKIKGLKQMIAESKQVDIEVEQKKREETR
jgi:tetratricopeptide (TPR) repeat protein